MLNLLHRTGFRALWTCRALLAALLALPLGGCCTTVPPHHPGNGAATMATTTTASMTGGMVQQNLVVLTPARHEPAFLLHLPGIGGHRNIDDHMAAGFVQGGFTGQVQIYDWTEQDIGLDALFALKRNHAEAKKVARLLTERFDLDPTAPIYLTCHSGGGGIAIWALEELPARIKISALVMMSPALSPGYDLSKALSHVSGKAYVFSSTEDSLVLGTGCQLMGTIDGVKTDAAGRVGFKMPPTADVGQYAKLVSVPYNAEWIRLGDHGDHIGAMSRRFNQLVIAPLVLSGRMPPQSAQEVMALAGSIQTPAAQSPTALSNSALPESLKQSTSHN